MKFQPLKENYEAIILTFSYIFRNFSFIGIYDLITDGIISQEHYEKKKKYDFNAENMKIE